MLFRSVSFELFARPALLRMMGRSDTHRLAVTARAAQPFTRRSDGKIHVDRVRVWLNDGAFVCERSGLQSSNVLSGMANANGLAFVPDGAGLQGGDAVTVWLLD